MSRCGTHGGYRSGCRCTDCKAAANRYEQQRRLDRYRGQVRYLSPVGTCRRIRALARLGWTTQLIGEAMGGVDKRHVSRFMDGTAQYVTVATEKAARRAYDQLSMKLGPSPRARLLAEKKGWPPPLAWDDDTIDDPAATPYVGTDRYGVDVDDIVWLIRCGGTWDSISARLGVTKDAVEKSLRRHGRTDVILELARGGSQNQWTGEVAS